MGKDETTQEAVRRYYSRFGTKLGYNLVMRGNKHFGYYDDVHTTEKSAQANFLKKLVDILDLQPGMRVLDAGCGQGYVATWLAANTGAHITGITLVPFEVDTASKLATKRGVSNKTSFMIADYSELSFDEESFDRIYAVETLSHAPDVKRVLANFYKLLKPSGRLVCVEYEFDSSKFTETDNATLDFAMNKGSLHGARQFDLGTFERSMKSVGFTRLQVYDWTKACLPSFQRIRRLAKPLRPLVTTLGLRNHFINTVVAHAYADWAEQGKFFFKVYHATKK